MPKGPASNRTPCHAAIARWMFAVLWLLLLPSAASAHPISLTEARVDITPDAIVVELDVMPEDLVMYYWMRPDESFRFRRDALGQQAEVHTGFLRRYLHLRTDEGRLDGVVESIDLGDLPDEGVHFEDLMAHLITYTIRFKPQNPAAFVTISQNFGGDDPAIPAEMTATFFRDGVTIDRAFVTHSGAHTTPADAPPMDDEAARERSFLGVTNYSAVYSYIYINRREVRHEFLIPLLTLNRFLPIIDSEDESMSIERQRETRSRIGEFFAENNSIKINGEPAAGRVDRIDFFGPEIRDFHTSPPEQAVNLYNARVGVILSFPATSPPESVDIEWLAYHKLPYFRSNIYPYDDERRSFAFNPVHPEYTWEGAPGATPEGEQLARSPLDIDSIGPATTASRVVVPVVILLLLLAISSAAAATRTRSAPRIAFIIIAITGVGAAIALLSINTHPRAIDEEDADAVFRHLHTRMYDALAHREDDEIYDALAASVADQLLEDLFLGVIANLRMMSEAGGSRRIDSVDIQRTALRTQDSPAPDRFAYESEWTVEGTLEHWGHIHTLKNRYRARFDIRSTSSGWRVTGFTPLAEEQVEVHSRLRR